MRAWWVLGVLAAAVLGGDPKQGPGGQFTWRQAGGNAARDSYRPAIRGGLLYVGGETLRALDAETGKCVGEREVPDVRYCPPVITRTGRVIAQRSDRVVECLTARLDKVIWQNRDSESTEDNRPSPALLTADLHIATIHEAIVAIDLASGKRRWSYPIEGEKCWWAPAADSERVFLAAGDAVIALDIGSGKVAWKTRVPKARFGPPAVIEGHVEFGTLHGSYHCLDAKSGRLEWSANLGKWSRGRVGHAPDSVLLSYGHTIAIHDLVRGERRGSPIATGLKR